ncbi:hypothetical protein OQA88_2604 [Cercophora sp. LCS_1]
MGSYISRETCETRGISVNCDVDRDPNNNSIITAIGGYERGDLPSEPDIAGIGVLCAFLVVTVVSLIFSIISTTWWWFKNVLHWKSRLQGEHVTLSQLFRPIMCSSSRVSRLILANCRARAQTKPYAFSLSSFLETFVITCSDQQIFTGCAYAVTLRYITGCTISAYHYNIVANMLLVTCATHLVAVTVSRNYWEHPLPAVVRILITLLVYAVTGTLLSNTGTESNGFPTQVPPSESDYSDILLPAVCFQTGDGGFTSTVQESLTTGPEGFFKHAIPGWTQYLVMFLCYVLAVVVRVFGFLRSGREKADGKRRRTVGWVKRRFSWFFGRRQRRALEVAFGLYLVVGNGVGVWTVYTSARFGDPNPENDPNTFGQLVPMFLNLMLLFAILQFLAEQLKARNEKRRARKKDEEHRAVVEKAGEMGDLEGILGSKKSTFHVVVEPAVDIDSDAITPDGGVPTETRKLSKPLSTKKPVVDNSTAEVSMADQEGGHTSKKE